MRVCQLVCVLTGSILGAWSAQAHEETSPAPAAGAPPAVTSLTASNLPGPQIQFATPVHEFGRVKAGDPVKYTYIFTNTGDQALLVSAVHPSCGCTTAGNWTKAVSPGMTGEIPIQFNSGNFNGPVFKTISVSSNDKLRPLTILQLKGTVWKPIELVPPFTIINLSADATNGMATVKIINNTGEAFTLEAPVCTNSMIAPELKTVQPGKEYQLVLHARAPLNTGTARGSILLKSSLASVPVVEVPFWMHIQPSLSVFPPQVMLAQPPLPAAAAPAVITIQNNSTTKLEVSEPAINVPGVGIDLREVQTGRVFTVQLRFPEGFEVGPGQHVELTAKTTSTSVPEIKVPILQLPRRSGISATISTPAPEPPPILKRATATTTTPAQIMPPGSQTTK